MNVFHLLYIIFPYFLGGLPVGRTAKRYGIPKTMLMDCKNNKYWETSKTERQTGLTDVETTSLKY